MTDQNAVLHHLPVGPLGGVVITEYTGEAEAVRFPTEIDGEPVRQIGISRNHIITQVELPDSVTNFWFDSCSNLTNIIIPDGVTSIGNGMLDAMGAFNGCSSLTKITIPDSVTRIDRRAFEGCRGLTVTYQGQEYTYASDTNWWD